MNKRMYVVFLLCSLLLAGCGDTDLGKATEAGMDAIRAASLDDQDVARLSSAVSGQLDRQHTVAPPDSVYAERLNRLVDRYFSEKRPQYNFKVYLSPEVNAFALGDGSIRVYSGLMDRMTDAELLFILGHEIGHVAEKHVKRKLMLAYAGSAVRKALASQQNEAGDLARSAVGALAQNLINAQFSQQEERAADDYGARLLLEAGYGIDPAVSALSRLASSGGDYSFLSSHPAPGARAERLQENTSSPQMAEEPSLLQRLTDWLLGLVS